MIQRYTQWCSASHGHGMLKADDGPYVTYADHLAALTVTDAMVSRATDTYHRAPYTVDAMRAALEAALASEHT